MNILNNFTLHAWIHLFLVLLGRFSHAYDIFQGRTIPFNPNTLPLAVRGPYLNTWLPQGPKPATLNSFWPNLWTGLGAVTGWYAAVKVDGKTCQVLGNADVPGTVHANQSSAQFTPTRTSFLMECEAVEVNATFLSPVEPIDLVKQSMPLSYFYMTARSTDGASHSVSMYSDVSAEWISGDDSKIVTWNTHVDSNYMILQMQLQTPQPYVEIADHAQDATGFYGMRASGGTSWQLSAADSTRLAFANASLSNAADAPSTFRAVNNAFPVLGLAVDLGNVTTATTDPSSALWAIGIMRDPTIQYMAPNGQIEHRHPYYQSAFDSTLGAVRMFIDDFLNALNRTIAIDAKVIGDGLRYSSDYADLISLNLRQAMGALEITLSQNADGSWNGTDIKAFMKDMGSLNSLSGVNQVDILYAAFPVYMYLNPELGGYLLAPLLEYQDTAMYTLPYAAMNIGSTFPNAIADGLNSTHLFGVEESANMLIMTLAHAQGGGNGTLISKHYLLLRRWAEYLVDNSLTPQNQLTADKPDLSANNQTNVALKGILGIAAMGRISSYAGVASDASNYTNIAKNYIDQWTKLAKSADNTHLVMNYGAQTTSGLMYNLYADKLLQLNLVPDEIYQIQTIFYNNAGASTQFGLPLDSGDPQITRSDWLMLSAATVDRDDTRDAMVSQIHLFAKENRTNIPWCVSYDPTSAGCLSGQNSPAVGGLFSLVALNQTIKSVTIPSEGSTIPGLARSSHKSNAGPIVGVIIAALVGLAIIGVGALFLRRHRNRRRFPLVLNGEKLCDGGRNSGKTSGSVEIRTLEPFTYASSGERGITTIPSTSYDGSPSSFNGTYSDVSGSRHFATNRPLLYGTMVNTTNTPVDMSSRAFVTTEAALNVRSSAYFRDPDGSSIGPSASQIRHKGEGANAAEVHPSSSSCEIETRHAKVTLVGALHAEMNNLRREGRHLGQHEESGRGVTPTNEDAPPSYDSIPS